MSKSCFNENRHLTTGYWLIGTENPGSAAARDPVIRHSLDESTERVADRDIGKPARASIRWVSEGCFEEDGHLGPCQGVVRAEMRRVGGTAARDSRGCESHDVIMGPIVSGHINKWN